MSTIATQKRGKGRPPSDIDTDLVEKLSSIHCTNEEIAAFFNVSTRTIERMRSKNRSAGIAEVGRAKGKISLRRLIFKSAEAGNIAAQIFLCKTVLGMRETTSLEHAGKEGGPIQIAQIDAIIKDARVGE